jgi:hypothetical protein
MIGLLKGKDLLFYLKRIQLKKKDLISHITNNICEVYSLPEMTSH